MKIFKNTIITLFSLTIMFAYLTCTTAKAEGNLDTVITVPITVQEEYTMANEFFQLLNQKRTSAGLPEYKLDAGLNEMAMTRAAQLCIYFSHASLVTDSSENDSLGDLQQGTSVQNSLFVMEDIAEGIADAKSTYAVWDKSSTHKPLLISTIGKYCGIGVVTYHNNIKWCLIVSDDPCGKTVKSVSGTKEKTRNIKAKAKYFSKNIYQTISANANSSKCGTDGYVNDMFVFADISGKSSSYYVTQPDVFSFRSNNPDLFTVDKLGRIKPLKTGTGSLTVSYNGLDLHTVSVKATGKRKTETESPVTVKPTETPDQSESTKQTEPKGETERETSNTTPPNQTADPGITLPAQSETTKQTETVKQTEPEKKTDLPKTPETKAPVQKKTFTVRVSSVTYNGKAQKPAVKVYDGKQRIPGKYYQIVKYQQNKNIGYGTVIIKGKGKYTQYSGTARFKILPGKVKITSVKGSGKTLDVKWAQNKGVSGYQISYGTDKKFRHGQGKKTGANAKSVKLKVSRKKTYYVRIRAYKKVGKEIWYSSWSAIKKVKTK